ncbi:MAG: ribosomal L7Ae/L30e/S12e/Gadd45 family protein [Nanoarchaeota archaeon]
MSLAELKKHVGNKKLLLGTDRTLKNLKKGELKEVFLSSNVAENLKDDIETISKKFGVKVYNLDITSDEMGVVVKKPFSVSVASLQK